MLLSVSGLDKSFGGVVAARNVSFDVDRAEMVALIGPNGAGKSTTFNMVGGQITPDRGSVVLAGEPITGLSARRIWRRGVGRTFQIAQTFHSMTAVDNVQVAIQSHHGESWMPGSLANRRHRQAAADIVASVGMADAIDRPVATLAYGDVKRVELAVALASQPRLLLMDEPTAGMAPRERSDLMTLVRRTAGDRGIGVLFTEHDMDAVFGHADRIVVMVRGEIVASGPPAAVRADPLVRRVYLGEIGSAIAEGARR